MTSQKTSARRATIVSRKSSRLGSLFPFLLRFLAAFSERFAYMAVTIECPKCLMRAKVKEELLGRRAKCNKCGEAMILVAARESPQEAATARQSEKPQPRAKRPPRVTDAEILAALDGEYPRVRHTPAYTLALLVVAGVMVLLPLIYVAIIALVGYGAFWHGVHNQGMLQVNARGKGYLLVLIAYAAPIIISVIVIGFMLKPLIPRWRTREREFELDRQDEAFLFAFVDKLCKRVGAPPPHRIVVQQTANAYAALQGGLLGSLFRRRVELGIGVPLVQGLSLPHFASILAHEFGHFGQFTGMRLYALIGSINAWFARVVFERDNWDGKLEELSQLDMRIAWVFHLSRGFVWLTRKLLRGLMLIGEAVSGRLSQQMEFDADRYAARLIGDQAYVETLKTTPLFSAAEDWSVNTVNRFYDEGKLVTNMSDLMIGGLSMITPEVRTRIVQDELEKTTSWYDTHPCLTERIANIEEEATPGILTLDIPATRLFANFSEMALQSTLHHYENALDREIQDDELVPTESLLNQRKETAELIEVSRRFVLGAADSTRPTQLPTTNVVGSPQPERTWQIIVAVRQRQAALRAEYCQHKQHYDEQNDECVIAERTESLFRSKLKFSQNIRGQSIKDAKSAATIGAELSEERQQLSELLHPYERAWGERLVRALQLVETAPYRDLLPPDVTLDLVNAWLDNLRRFDGFMIHWDRLNADFNRLQAHLETLRKNPKDERLLDGALRESKRLRATVAKCREVLLTVPYGFAHDRPDISVAEYLLLEPLETDDPLTLSQQMEEFGDGILNLRQRMLGRLMQVAELVETSGGLEPIPIPEDHPKKPL